MSDQEESLEQLLDRFNIENWDLLLIGDGSGSKWGNETGWACVAVLPNIMQRKVFYGASNNGTVNVAEMMAYINPLLWFLARQESRRKKGNEQLQAYDVHIITDSSYVAQRGNDSGLNFDKNQPLWAVFEMVRRQGIRITWHHANREDVELNKFADAVSKAARLTMKENRLCDDVKEKTGLSESLNQLS